MNPNKKEMTMTSNREMNSEFNFSQIPLSDKEFYDFKELVYQRLGIHLTEQKRPLLTGRLQKILRMHNFKSYHEYYQFLVADKTNDSLSELANRISTNHTYFYREKEHFDYFIQKVLPELVARHQKQGDFDLRIWCAGCSSGEEPYTLAMLMLEYFNSRKTSWNTSILATDISAKVLDIAKAGIYPNDRLHSLPLALRTKYFTPQADGQWLIQPQLREQVTYRRFNLINQEFPFRRPFDIIFCRNVMIYFDEPTRETLTKKFYKWLVPHGYLFIGHSETLRWNKNELEYIMPAVYRKRGEA